MNSLLTVLANGGLVAESGSQLLAQAAQYHSVPVMVCVGLYKVTWQGLIVLVPTTNPNFSNS